ncbi:MAG: efflux RND transporter permease subunit [Rhodothermaceae bacterium]
MDVAKFSVKNPILVNLLMIGLFVFGTIALLRMPTELNPDINFNWVIISVPYPGASPTEIENQIIDPIETEISDVDKIKEILSTASEGVAVVFIKLEDISDTRFREILNDVKSEVDKVDLPDDAEDPIIDDFSSGEFLPVIDINMSFSIPEANALKIADDLEEDLKDVDGVGKVQVSGYADREIWVEIDPEKLNAYNLTFEDVFMAIRVRNLNVPGGNISIGKTEYLIRSIGEYENVEEISNTVVRSNSNGRNIKVRDVAKVSNRRQELVILSRLNGDQSISFSVSKKSEANSLDIIDEIKLLVETYKNRVPDGVEFGFFNDNSVYINRVIGILKNNAITGMILIAFILYVNLLWTQEPVKTQSDLTHAN